MLLALLLVVPAGRADPGTPGEGKKAKVRSTILLTTSVIGSAGSPGTSDQFKSNGTLGQPTPIGAGSAEGMILYAGFWGNKGIATTRVEESVPGVPENRLFQSFPNPFNPMATIEFTVGKHDPVTLSVFNIKGQLVRTLVRETMTPGRYQSRWDGRDDQGTRIASGVYLYRLQVGSYTCVKKMVLVK